VRTPSQTVGPYYAIGMSRRLSNELVPPADPTAMRLDGRLYDGEGSPVPDGLVEVWDASDQRWGRSGTDEDGAFSFVVAKPSAMSGAAPHLEVLVFARGLLRHQRTRVYFPDEVDGNAVDPVLSSLDEADRARLVAEAVEGGISFDIHLQGPSETVFFTS
jgi:protocatechuate 3,4-dioxygenase, alpha subunit